MPVIGPKRSWPENQYASNVFTSTFTIPYAGRTTRRKSTGPYHSSSRSGSSALSPKSTFATIIPSLPRSTCLFFIRLSGSVRSKVERLRPSLESSPPRSAGASPLPSSLRAIRTKPLARRASPRRTDTGRPRSQLLPEVSDRQAYAVVEPHLGDPTEVLKSARNVRLAPYRVVFERPIEVDLGL